jgi:hypothetical protein
MSDRILLSWDRRSGRWFKRFRIPGSTKYKTFCVSAKVLHEQTGCPPTRTGSEKAAREWWRIKQNELVTGDADSITAAIGRRLAKDAAIAAKIGDTSTAAILHAAAAEIGRRAIAGEAIPEFDQENGTFLVEQSPRNRLVQLLLDSREAAVEALKPERERQLRALRNAEQSDRRLQGVPEGRGRGGRAFELHVLSNGPAS